MQSPDPPVPRPTPARPAANWKKSVSGQRYHRSRENDVVPWATRLVPMLGRGLSETLVFGRKAGGRRRERKRPLKSG